MEFRTERLVLRPAREDDLAAMHAVLSHPKAMAYWSSAPHEHRRSDTRLARVDDRHPAAMKAKTSSSSWTESSSARQAFGASRRSASSSHPDHWGRGYAAEALTLVLERAFHVHDLAKVDADVDPRNLGSLKLLTRLGFRETGRKERTWFVGGAGAIASISSSTRPAGASTAHEKGPAVSRRPSHL